MQAIEGCRLDGLHLMRILIKELRVMSRELIVPTYKIPALVRAPEGQVELTGFEPASLSRHGPVS